MDDETFLSLADERTIAQYRALQEPGVCVECGSTLTVATPANPGQWCTNAECRSSPKNRMRDYVDAGPP